MTSPTDIRDLFLTCGRHASRQMDDETVRASWNDPSALPGYTVGGLCGHLSRAVLTVDDYLDRASTGSGHPIDAARYFAVVLGSDDPVESDLHATIRARGADAAADGPAALSARTSRVLDGLGQRLHDDALRGVIEVRDGITLTIAEYLRTRLVELVVHLDDLAVSVERPGPDELPEAAHVEVAAVLGALAALRGSGLDTVRSLSRAERHPAAVRAL